MKKILLVMMITSFSLLSQAQKGNNQIGVAFEAGIPVGDFGNAVKTGFGGSLKGLLGVGEAGQVTLTAGYTTFTFKDASDVHFNIVPILLGYRHNFSGFYVEPQAGYGSYAFKQSGVSVSTGEFTWAIGLGYAMSGFDIGARYQAASKDGSTTGLVGLHVGYNFSLGGSASK